MGPVHEFLAAFSSRITTWYPVYLLDFAEGRLFNMKTWKITC